MTRLASFCFRRRWPVIAVWIVLLLVLGAASRLVGAGYTDSFDLPGTESARAVQLLEDNFEDQSGDQDRIVFETTTGTVTDAAVRRRIEPMLAEVAKAGHVADVASPFTKAGAAQVSKDGTIAYATVTFDGQPGEDVPVKAFERVIELAQDAGTSRLEVDLGGNGIAFATQQFSGNIGEVVGVMAAAVILFIAFGSLFAMLTPLLTAVVAIGSALSTAGLLAQLIDIATFAPTLASLIGLGVGIDYALFIVTRHRNAIKEGATPEEAVRLSLNTSGRAVIFAAITVCIAMLGMLVLGVQFLNGVAIAASIAVLFTMAASITLLPAILGLLGMKVLSRKERRSLAEQGPGDPNAGSAFARWAQTVQRRPGLLAIGAVLLMLVIAIPVTQMRLGSSDAGNDRAGSTTRQAYDRLADGFGPGFNGPLQVVAETNGDAARIQSLAALTKALGDTKGVVGASGPVPSPNKQVAIINVVPTTSPQAKATSDLIQRMRDDVIPNNTQLTTHVGGLTAVFDDFADELNAALPLFILVIVVLGCLLLMLAFRSIVVPVLAAGMNLLAAGAAFGIVTLVFQLGLGSGIPGFGEGPIEAFLPVMLLAILFGLSMDYQVFLVSRMHEEWLNSGDNHRAVQVGQADTGRVITAAATIMIVVFLSFLLLGQRIISEFSLGLAIGVFLDAFILRTILVPSLMHLIGKRNWWLPKWLDRVLPHLSVEGGRRVTPQE